VLGIGELDEDELYTALDWLHERQPSIENALAKRHLQNGTLVLSMCRRATWKAAAARSHCAATTATARKASCRSFTDASALPMAARRHRGVRGQHRRCDHPVTKLKQRFGLDHVVLVGDRGMITEARISEDIKPAGLDWITALRAPAIQELLASGALQLSLFDDRDMASVTAPDFPGERLVVCRNPDLAAERKRKRTALLDATERDLHRIQTAAARKRDPLRGAAEIAVKFGWTRY